MRAYNSLAAIVFALLAGPFLIWSAITTPPFQVPDEYAHYMYALAVATGTMLPVARADGSVGAPLPDYSSRLHATVASIQGHNAVKFTLDTRARFFAVQSDGSMPFKDFAGSALYPPTAYLTAGAGLFVANALGMTPGRAFFAGRLANALLYLLAGSLALALLPAGSGALLAALLLPMAVTQAASFSADASIFSLAALGAALLARDAARQDGPRWSVAIATALLFGVAAGAKLPLAALALPVALVFGRGNAWRGVLSGLLVLALPIGWTLGFTHPGAFYPPGISPSGQLSALLAHPAAIIDIAFATLHTWGHNYWQTMIGILGWFDNVLPDWVYSLCTATLFATAAVAALETPQTAGAGPTRLRDRFSLVLGALLAAGLIFAALYLTWTQVGAPIVNGVQGRYFIPLLPVVVAALAGLWPRIRVPWTSLFIAALAAGVWLPVTAWTIVQRYYSY